jgi:hypothetical protein
MLAILELLKIEEIKNHYLYLSLFVALHLKVPVPYIIILLCLMLDDFTHQGERAVSWPFMYIVQ